ncbi:MAG: DNA-protecting protein DprA [Clostridia bacterium]|nr:DNA-protecting protein DprA [Clostridia bacterium]
MWTAEEKSYIWLDSFALDATEKNALVAEAGGVVNLVKRFAAFEDRFDQKGRAELYRQMQETLQDDGYFKRLQALYEREGITCITRATDGYVAAWRELPDAPCVIYVQGDESLLAKGLFAVVGSRKISDAYKKAGETICKDLAGHFTLLTGVAEGGDETAAKGGLQGGKVVCMAAGGLGRLPKDGGDFIAECKRKGAVISACPYDTPVRNYSYERRNKLIAACAEGVLVLAAGKKSGALKTAEYAFAFGKKVFALPYLPGSQTGEGCNALIKKGAYLTENLFDISSRFGINLIEKIQAPSLTTEESQVYEGVKAAGESHLSALSQAVGMPVFKLAAVLAKLEVKGLVVKMGGNKFSAR